MKEITTNEELDALLAEHKHECVVLDIYATWCKPCQRLAPHLEEFERKYDLVLIKVDVDKVEHGREKDDDGVRKNELLRRFNLKTIPLVHVWENGENVYIGDSDHEKLEKALIEVFAGKNADRMENMENMENTEADGNKGNEGLNKGE